MPLCDDFDFCGGLCEYTHCNEEVFKYDNDDLRTGFTFAASTLTPSAPGAPMKH